MGLLNYLGGRGSSSYGEGSSRHVESDVGGVTVGGAALEEEKSWEQPDPSVDNVPFTSFDEARPSDKRYARRHRFRLRWFDYYLLDAKRFVVIVTNMTAMVLLVNNRAREFGRDSILTFVWIMVAIGFLDTLADPEEGRRVLASCGVKVTRLRSTLTALLVWFVLVSLVRSLAITVFEVVTDFNAERGNPENGKI